MTYTYRYAYASFLHLCIQVGCYVTVPSLAASSSSSFTPPESSIQKQPSKRRKTAIQASVLPLTDYTSFFLFKYMCALFNLNVTYKFRTFKIV